MTMVININNLFLVATSLMNFEAKNQR